MKSLHLLLIATILSNQAHALDSNAILGVAAQFENSTPDQQYKAKLELNKLIDDATIPGKGDPAEVTKTLVSALQSKGLPPEAIKYALRAMSRVATADAVPFLTQLINAQDPFFQEEARQVLESIRDPKSVTVLEAALRNGTSTSPKMGLMNSLAVQEATSSIPLITPFILDPDLDIAQSAVRALARIGGDQASDTLKKANASSKIASALKPDIEKALLITSSENPQVAQEIFKSTKSESVRLVAFIALTSGALDSSVTPIIEQSLRSENSELRHAALTRAIAMNLPSLQSGLAQAMAQMPLEDRMVTLANLHHLKPADLAEKIALSCVTSAEQGERIAAIAALGKMASKPAFEALLQALGDRTPAINQAAGTAIAAAKYPEAESSLLADLKGSSSSGKILAIKAVVFRQIPGANEALLEIISGADEAASKEAMKVLYFTATLDDLRALCAKATAIQDPEQRKPLASICSKIATRIDTDTARELVKPLQ